MQSPENGLFTWEYLQMVYVAAFYWREALADKTNEELKEERRRFLARGNNYEYRKLLKD